MARLKYTHSGDKRSVNFTLHLTPGEDDELRRRAGVIGISRSDFSRAQLFDRPLPKRRPEVSRLLFAALAAIGNNVNQLARVANVGGLPEVEHDARAVMKELRAAIVKLVED